MALFVLHFDCRWLEHVLRCLDEDMDMDFSNISWAAYHASKLSRHADLPAISALLPLFPDDSVSFYDTSCNGCDQVGSAKIKPWTDTSNYNGSASLQPWQANSMDLARNTRGA